MALQIATGKGWRRNRPKGHAGGKMAANGQEDGSATLVYVHVRERAQKSQRVRVCVCELTKKVPVLGW